MMCKKILIVSRSFYPQNNPRSFRTTELAKELARKGHQVTILTPRDESVHPKLESEYGFTIKDLGQPNWPKIQIKGTGILYWARRILKRLLSWFFEYPSIEWLGKVKQALKNERDYDALISIAVPYPIHWGVASVWRKQSAIAKVWIADCGDPYMLQENDTVRPIFYFKYVEKWAFRKFDYITIPIEEARSRYYQEFHHKIKIIPQAFKFDDVTNPPMSIDVHSCPHFAYGGSINAKVRNPRELIDYLLSTNKPFKFVVYTSNAEIIQDLVDRSDGKVEIKPIMARLDFLNELSQYDFVVNISYRNGGQLPSKLIDYSIIGKPILSLRTGYFDPEVVDQFMNGDYSNSYVVENPDQYRIEHVARQFLLLMSPVE
jgi:hypothetical protein